jgi:hypothetical protein
MDIVEQLRDAAEALGTVNIGLGWCKARVNAKLLNDAIAEIERLRAKNAKQKVLLRFQRVNLQKKTWRQSAKRGLRR